MFNPRLIMPDSNNKYYISTANGGYNPCLVKPDGSTLMFSNCVFYAWGRGCEILGGKTCNLCMGNAGTWYAYNDGYKRGKTPKVGSIIVWSKDGGAGHVAVVEKVISPSCIVTSESGWGCAKAFWTQTRYNTNNNWGQANGYHFLGFIYLTDEDENNDNEEKQENKSTQVTILPTMKVGSKGDNVRKLQEALVKEKQLRPNEVDGDFGIITRNAVLGFQLDNKLEVDGIVGPATQRELFG